MEQDIAAQVVGLGGASDFSLWKLFLRADFVVKFVIILLIACSIFSWALIFDKLKLFKNINKSIEEFEKKFWKAKSPESFQSIAISRNTSLAIVAPGIAEALFATALGLLAAIPAVVAYNKFNSDTQKYFSRIDHFSKRLLSII